MADEVNYSSLDGEGGSSNPDEENGINYGSDFGYSSDELFDEIHMARASNILRARVTSPPVPVKKPKKNPFSKLDPDAPYTNGRARGMKRKHGAREDENPSMAPKRKYSRQRKMIKGMEMFWNSPTESYGLQKPKTIEEYNMVVRWSLAQLPKKSGTAEEVFSTLKEFGWPELKKGNTREALICKNTIAKLLYEQFVELSQNEKGEAIFAFNSDGEYMQVAVDMGEEEIGEFGDEEAKIRGGHNSIRHRTNDYLPESAFIAKANELNRHFRNQEIRRRETRRRTSSSFEGSIEGSWREDDLMEEPFDGNQRDLAFSPTNRKRQNAAGAGAKFSASKEGKGRGRRWVRFACEKHRREHARCPDNCVMRKKSYIDDSSIPEDELEMMGYSREDSSDDLIVDTSSMDNM
jgi:hypothetical protein